MKQESLSEKAVIALFEQHVNSGKVAMYRQMGLDMAPGRCEEVRIWTWDGSRSPVDWG